MASKRPICPECLQRVMTGGRRHYSCATGQPRQLVRPPQPVHDWMADRRDRFTASTTRDNSTPGDNT